jgi:hypothetical protein
MSGRIKLPAPKAGHDQPLTADEWAAVEALAKDAIASGRTKGPERAVLATLKAKAHTQALRAKYLS